MDRRQFITGSSLAALGFTLSSEQLFANLLFAGGGVITPIRGNCGIYTEKGGTMLWYIAKEGVAVVDAQFPDSAGNFLKALKKQTDRKVDLLINTHHHADHTAGNVAFQEMVTSIVAHENSKKNQEAAYKASKKKGKAPAYPTETFKDVWNKEFAGEVITCYHQGPGHTNGDIFVHFENADIVHCGDLVFNRKYPYIDTANGANIEGWITQLDEALENFERGSKFVFGHSRSPEPVVGHLEDILDFRDYLSRMYELVGKMIKDGKSDEDILKVTEIPGAETFQGEGIQRSLQAAIQELRPPEEEQDK